MKYYIIYKDDHFLGYTTNKKLLNNFLDNREGKYHVEKIKEEEIPDKIKNSFNFTNYELTEYTNYYTDNDTVLFNYEYTDVEECMIKDSLALQYLLSVLIKDIDYLKITDEERKIIQYSFYRIIDDLNAITDSNEIIFDEIINIRKYFYERYLPNRRDTKDIIENSSLLDW